MNQTLAKDEPSNQPRNFWLTVINGGLVLMGASFFTPPTVLAALTQQLTDSSFCVGLLVSIGPIGMMWPQLIVGNLVEPVRRKLPVYIVTSVLRVLVLLAMGAAIFFWRGGDFGLFWVILALYFLFASASGVAIVPFLDIVGKSFNKDRLAVLWSYRRVLGGLLGFAASLLVTYVLSGFSGLDWPDNYALLMVLGATVCAVAYVCFTCVREEDAEVAERRVPFLAFLRRGPVILRRDPDFRRFLLLRGAWAVTRMSQLALFVPMAMDYFEASAMVTGGAFTALVLLVGSASSYLCGRASQRYGELKVMRVGAALHIMSLVPALALGLLHLAGALQGTGRGYLAVYVIMYACGAAAINFCDITGMVYLLSLPSSQLRPTYVAFMNTLNVPLLFAPAAAGLLAERLSYPAVFVLSLVSALWAWRLTGQLTRRSHEGPAGLGLEE